MTQGSCRRDLAVLVLATALITAGCGRKSALVRLANELYPPIRPADHQVAAVQGAARDIEGLGSALIYVGVSARDLQAHVPADVRSRTADATGIEVRLGQQEVVVEAGFDVRVPADEVRIRGDVVAHCAASVEEGALVLRPSASLVRVRRIDYRGNKAPDLLIAGINLAIDTFLANLNGAIQAQRVPLDMSAMHVFDTTRLLNGLETVSAAQGKVISVDVALGRTSVLIDPEGIHVIADAVVLTQEHFDRTLNDLEGTKAAPARAAAVTAPVSSFTSDQLALLSLCPSLPAGLDARVERLRAVCDSLDASTGTMIMKSAAKLAEEEGEEPAEGLDVLYPRFRETFLSKAELVDRRENLFWDRTAVAISRRSLAADVNAVLAHGQGSASLRFPDYAGDLKEPILTPDPPDLKCAENAGGCDSDFTYRPYNPRGCDSDCTTMNCHGPSWARICIPGVDLGCLGRKADCERLKEQERLAYEAEKAAAFVAWKIRKDACELAKAAKLAGCQINQDWLNLVGNKDVGEIQARWQAESGELHVVLGGLRVGDDFDSFSLKAALSGGANVAADFTFIPHNAGHLACVAQWSGRVHATALLPLQELSFSGRLTSARNEERSLVLTFALPAETFDVKVEPPPALALVTQNPQIAAYCPVPTLIVAQIAALAGSFDPVAIYALVKLGEAALKDTFQYEMKEREITLELPERTLMVGGRPVTLFPRWQERSIVIYAR